MILDEDEYARHSESMSYPEEIDFIIKKEMHRIMEDVEKQIKPFNRQYVENHFQQYLEQLTNQ
jgi:protein associated with RNAse G/E